jgi:hypothetical protein
MHSWRSPTQHWSPMHRSRVRPPELDVPLEEAEAPLERFPSRLPLEERRDHGRQLSREEEGRGHRLNHHGGWIKARRGG